jgi:hypothetical protein
MMLRKIALVLLRNQASKQDAMKSNKIKALNHCKISIEINFESLYNL